MTGQSKHGSRVQSVKPPQERAGGAALSLVEVATPAMVPELLRERTKDAVVVCAAHDGHGGTAVAAEDAPLIRVGSVLAQAIAQHPAGTSEAVKQGTLVRVQDGRVRKGAKVEGLPEGAAARMVRKCIRSTFSQTADEDLAASRRVEQSADFSRSAVGS